MEQKRTEAPDSPLRKKESLPVENREAAHNNEVIRHQLSEEISLEDTTPPIVSTHHRKKSRLAARKAGGAMLGLFPAFGGAYIVPILLLCVTLPFGSVHLEFYALSVITTSAIALFFLMKSLLRKDEAVLSANNLFSQERETRVLTPSTFIILSLLTTVYALCHSLAADKTSPLVFLNSGGSDLIERTGFLAHPVAANFHRSLLPEFLEHFLPAMALVVSGFIVTYHLFFAPHEENASSTAPNPSDHRVDSLVTTVSPTGGASSAWGMGSHLIPLQLLALVGAAVGLVALSSWLTDNGKLFWIFQAEYEVPSPRARWPFVNPNHLGFFLLPLFFLSLTLSVHRALLLFTLLTPKSNRRHTREKFAEILGRQSTQRQIAACGGTVLLSVVMLIGVIASLSRACWIGLLLGLGVFMIANSRTILSFESASRQIPLKRSGRSSGGNTRFPPPNGEGNNRNSPSLDPRDTPYQITNRRFSSQGRARFSLLLGSSILLVVFIVTFFLFSAGEGKNRIESRFLYGLTSSHDDMRWELFIDSLPLITFWGSGVSQWDELYRTVQSVQMAGLEPVYLHSEPLQILIELGVPGLVLFALLFFFAPYLLVRSRLNFRQTFHPIYPQEFQKKLELELSVGALLAGWSAVTIALFFDFATRIPANLLLLAVLAAVSIGYAEKLSRTTFKA